jgi:hypothetical protein
MISKSLTRRLEDLESRLLPATEMLVIQIVFVASDRSVSDGPRFTIPNLRTAGSAMRRR